MWYNVKNVGSSSNALAGAVQSPFRFEIDTADTGFDCVAVHADYDVEKGQANVLVDGKGVLKLRMGNACSICAFRLMLLCATDGDSPDLL